MNTSNSSLREAEQKQQKVYDEHYKPANYAHHWSDNDYFARLAKRRFQLIRENYQSGRILDLCCGAGDYLVPVAEFADEIIGLDFSAQMVEATRAKIGQANFLNTSCVQGTALDLPFPKDSFSLVFSFSSLYSIPQLDKAITECSRVLKTSGVAVLDLGGGPSLNSVVSRAEPETVTPYVFTLSHLRRLLEESSLQIEADHAFQILPYWGSRPLWMRPLLHPLWKRLMARYVGGRMWDEVVSNAPLLRNFAFRHIFVCRKSK